MKASATAADIARAVGKGDATAREVVEAALARIVTHNETLGAFTDVTADRAIAKATAVDNAIASGGKPPPLAGVPFAVKNLYDVRGLVTRAGSKINLSNPPAKADATLITRLEAAGAVLIGTTNMDEYASGFAGENPHDGPSHNPHDLERMTGGSSSGSAAAVASGLVPLALGSDTNGSIRVPASLSGLFALKPTYGRLSRARTFPFAASLDHMGALGRSARDLAAAYDAMQGFDDDDPAQTKRPNEPTEARLRHPIPGVRIGVAIGYFAGDAESQAHVSHVAKALDAARMVTVRDAQAARAAAYIITMAEGGALHLDRLRERQDDFDPEVRDRMIAGAMLPGAWVQKAQKLRRVFRDKVLELFEDVDAILAPATPIKAPKLGQKTMRVGGIDLPVRQHLGIFTQPISFIGLPVVTVPVWLSNEALPMGVQIIAAPWREDICLRIAHQLETAGAVAAPVAKAFAEAS
jgi:aspartyl-tRNA(Asn)/glutamyl-tRNA(Gln) amidotransferase subunit A